MDTSHAANRILVVEDQIDLWRLLQVYLRRLLPQVPAVHAINGPAALTYLHDCLADGRPLPRLILSNLYMPRLEDGLSFLASLNEPDSGYASLPVVVLSSSVNPGDSQQATQYGATFFTKPISYDEWYAFFSTIQHYWPEEAALKSA